MAKKDNKSHHDNGIQQNFNRQAHANSFIQRRDPRLNQQEIAEQNIMQNNKEGNLNYEQVQIQLTEAAEEFNKGEFEKEE